MLRGELHPPGLPALPSYAPLLQRAVREGYEAVPDVFERHPPPGGVVPPPRYLAVLRPREAR